MPLPDPPCAPEERWSWVFSQEEIWIDRHGRAHALAEMPGDYVANVVSFVEDCAGAIQLLILEEQGALERARLPFSAGAQVLAELEQTPLLRALRRRLALDALLLALQEKAAQPTIPVAQEASAAGHGREQSAGQAA